MMNGLEPHFRQILPTGAPSARFGVDRWPVGSEVPSSERWHDCSEEPHPAPPHDEAILIRGSDVVIAEDGSSR